jgi:hypothetical protein
MWVDVVFMRREGVKKPKEEIRAAKPYRAQLEIRPSQTPGEPYAILFPPDSRLSGLGFDYQRLNSARVLALRHGSIFVAGIQPDHQGKHRQAWWCRIVDDHDPQAYKAPLPLHLDPQANVPAATGRTPQVVSSTGSGT